MGCNPRIPLVVPGIMRAAQQLDAVVAFELSGSEGGLDGGYTGQTPAGFAATIINYAEENSFTKPFVIHADHIIVADNSAQSIDAAIQLIRAQLDAGFTSFAIDASSLPLSENIAVTAKLAALVQESESGIEVEVGEVKHVGCESNLTEVADARNFLAGLQGDGIRPHLLAIDNGSKSGNYLDGNAVHIDLERTGEIYAVSREFGLAGLVQHGITGTPLRIVGRLAEFGIRKGNIGTLWQNVAHAGLPLDLMDAIRKWSRENQRDIRYSTAIFRSDIESIPAENVTMIQDMAFREATEFIKAFHAEGSASKLAKVLKG
jgi:fructose-bisphosphate aldolase class II